MHRNKYTVLFSCNSQNFPFLPNIPFKQYSLLYFLTFLCMKVCCDSFILNLKWILNESYSNLTSLCQRWCWRHPPGSDLLRMASFQNNIYHEKDDIRFVSYSYIIYIKFTSLSWSNEVSNGASVIFRNLELVLFGGQQMCVIVDLGEEMPSPADIQVAHTRLRTLCLGGQCFWSISSVGNILQRHSEKTQFKMNLLTGPGWFMLIKM